MSYPCETLPRERANALQTRESEKGKREQRPSVFLADRSMQTMTTPKKKKRTRLFLWPLLPPPLVRSCFPRGASRARVLFLPFFVVVKYLPSDMATK